MTDDTLNEERAAQVEREGKERFGDSWPKLLGALGRRGVDRTALANVMKSPDATSILALGGREALVEAASNGDHEAERTYSEIRRAERKSFALSRGRRWVD
jgi:hypothetical protein